MEMFDRNVDRGGPTGPHMYVFRAAAYAELGKNNEAQAVIDKILKSHATFPFDEWLSQWVGPGDRLNKTMSDLYRLGLPIPPQHR